MSPTLFHAVGEARVGKFGKHFVKLFTRFLNRVFQDGFQEGCERGRVLMRRVLILQVEMKYAIVIGIRAFGLRMSCC